ncbi:hypothetical protein ACF09J_18865 [Streptomyces sp. NPDC014889]|uniref:hypothetical protein n=1 Tax=Streptomyces sp. NPDC014889 TaxID=3364928 RepID=UPI0036FDC3B6
MQHRGRTGAFADRRHATESPGFRGFRAVRPAPSRALLTHPTARHRWKLTTGRLFIDIGIVVTTA